MTDQSAWLAEHERLARAYGDVCYHGASCADLDSKLAALLAHASTRPEPERLSDPVATVKVSEGAAGPDYEVWLSDGMWDVTEPGEYPLYTRAIEAALSQPAPEDRALKHSQTCGSVSVEKARSYLMSEFKNYRKKNVQPMRPYVEGEDMTGISVNKEDTPEVGGMIAVNPANGEDRWYVAKQFFADNYIEA